MNTIGPFRGEYEFLSNFFPRDIIWKLDKEDSSGLVTFSEMIYQIEKFRDPEDAYFLLLLTPGQAKRAANKLKDLWKPNWHEIKTEVMLRIVRAKFNQHPDLAKRLQATGTDKLVEINYWHDNFWGDCTCNRCRKIEGENWLGRILTQVREELITLREENLKRFGNRFQDAASAEEYKRFVK